MIKIIIDFENKTEVRNWIINDLAQEDGRYLLVPEDIDSLTGFIYNKAIIVEEREIPYIKEPSSEELNKIPAPQEYHKYIAFHLLQLNNIKKEEIRFEYPLYGRKADVYADQNSKIIIVECCSCYIKKPIEYLEEQNTELWIIT